ncbi:MAG: nucleotidyl transferase AbiEii/AbiGii toxin family protein [bacterium]
MLSQSFLNDLTTRYQTFPENVYREYLQHLILNHLYQQKVSDQLFFKGGTALRLIHRSPRFSEDLDFDTNLHQVKVWESVIENALLSLSHETTLDIAESKPTTGGYLGVFVSSQYGQLIKIKFEISFRRNHTEGTIRAVQNDYLPPYSLYSVTDPFLVSGKLSALFDRAKARDFYDLYILLRMNLLTPTDKKQLVAAKKLLEGTTLNFDTQLKHLLPRSHWMIIKDFKTTLLSELERFTR